jgi:hypothetical protein
MAYDVTTPLGRVRLLINDTTSAPVFADADIAAFLEMEDGHVKRAGALACEVIAGDEALTSKAIRTQDLATDGPKTAEILLKQAQRWRDQADKADDDADEGFFAIVPMVGGQHAPELTQHQHFPGYWP